MDVSAIGTLLTFVSVTDSGALRVNTLIRSARTRLCQGMKGRSRDRQSIKLLVLIKRVDTFDF